MPSLPVKPEFGPSLPELVKPRVLAVLGAILAVAAAAFVLSGGASSGETHVVIRDPIAFNLRYGEALDRVDTMPGELLRLTGRDQSLTI